MPIGDREDDRKEDGEGDKGLLQYTMNERAIVPFSFLVYDCPNNNMPKMMDDIIL